MVASCAASRQNKQLNKTLDASMQLAARQYLLLDKATPDNLLPRSINPNGTLMTNTTDWWTSGFFPGSLWYIYEYTKNDTVKNAAIARTLLLEQEKFNTRDHDIGFKIMCSYGNQLRILNDTSAKRVIVTAAQSLTKRFNPTVGSIRSWGANNDMKNFQVIIDNMMNLELLFAAARFTKDSSYYKTAVAHAETTMANHYRADGSSYHVVEYNPNTGKVTKKRTHQGYADESAWARGQAWGLYGFVVCYRETKDARYLAKANSIARFLLNHPNLPADKVPYWDFDAPNLSTALRDASAASITASALLELSQYANATQKKDYVNSAVAIITNLSLPPYRATLGENRNFLLKHSVGHLPGKSEIDVPLSYADYYYLEAIMRYRNMNKIK
jgi:hypothetical protein